MARIACSLVTTDGETLDYVAIAEPLPETYEWHGRTFRRVEDTHRYTEVEKPA